MSCEKDFIYQGSFDPGIARRFLGLDGGIPLKIPRIEKERLATMLLKHGYLTETEIDVLGGRVVKIGETKNKE